MSIAIPKLREADKGRWVTYIGHAGELRHGRIKSWNQSFIFVVYKCDNNWDNYEDYTAEATHPTQLLFEKESENKNYDRKQSTTS